MIKFLDSIQAEDLNGKKVLLRVDFNVPVKEGKVNDDFKIKSHQETLNYLLENGAKLLLVSHHDNLPSFLSITEEVGEIIGHTMSLVSRFELPALDLLFQTSPILLLDNIRQDKREEENNKELALEISKGFDFFVNDAFAVSHRRHALTSAITEFLPSYGGFLMKKEVDNLSSAIRQDPKGKVMVLGGAKISTKLPVIENFLDKAEKILVGGALANNFWQAQGIKVGASLVEDSVAVSDPVRSSPFLKKGGTDGAGKIFLPKDILISKGWTREKMRDLVSQGYLALGDIKVDPLISEVKDLDFDEAIVDIGPQSAKDFAEIIKKADMVIWNGSFGLSEVGEFTRGTSVIAKAVAEAKQSIIGGGDTIVAAAKLGLLDRFSYVSTGGGAMLEFLAGNRLPGLEALGYYD